MSEPAHDPAELRRATAYMLAAAVAYAALYSCGHALAARCDWRVTALVRAASNFVLMLAWAHARRIPLPFLRPKSLWVRSGAGALSLLLVFYSLPLLPVSDSLTLLNTSPLWIALLAALLLRERGGPLPWLAAAIGFCGVVVLERPRLEGALLPIAAALLGALCGAVAMLGLRKVRGVDSVAVVAHFGGVSTLAVLLALLPASGTALRSFRLDAVTVLLLAGVAASGTLAQVALTRAYALAPAARNAPVSFTEIGFGVMIDRVIFHRVFSASALVGMALVLLPAAWLLATSAGPPSAAPAPTNE